MPSISRLLLFFSGAKPQRVSGYLLSAIIFIGQLGPAVGRLNAQASDPLSDIGVPPFLASQPIENGWIGMANGNLHLEFPLASFPQRGRAPIMVSLVYD